MRTVRSILTVATLGIAMLAGAPKANAGTVLNAKITQVSVEGTSHVTVKFSLNISGKPACATPIHTMAFDASTGKGKAMLSVVNAAFLSNLTVAAVGANACTTVTGISYETLNSLAMIQ